MPVIEVRGLVKQYRLVKALKGVDLAVEQGEIYGLLGRNGAGKTSMVKILLGIVKPSGGSVALLGRPGGDPASRERVGYLPEDHRFPDYHTAATALDFYGALCGMKRADRVRRIPEMISLVGLKDATKQKVRTYSKGMKQRLGLAQALIHDPEVLFLDEPTDGVDPVGRKEIRELIAELKARKKTIFLNSHLLSEVEMICDRVGILELGLLRREGSVRDLTKSENTYTLTFDRAPEPILAGLQSHAKGIRRVASGIEAVVEDVAQLNGLIDYVRAQGFNITGVAEHRQSLEEVFLQTLDTPKDGAAA